MAAPVFVDGVTPLNAANLNALGAEVNGKVTNGGGVPKITAQAISAGPPAGPADGDIWIATGVDARGTVWQFRYNAGSASAYKWEFIGGPAVVAPPVDTAENTASGVPVDLATVGPFFALPRPGDYTFEYGCRFSNTLQGNGNMCILAVNNVDLYQQFAVAPNAGSAFWLPFYAKRALAGLTASVAKFQYAAVGGTAYFDSRTLSVLPTRVS